MVFTVVFVLFILVYLLLTISLFIAVWSTDFVPTCAYDDMPTLKQNEKNRLFASFFNRERNSKFRKLTWCTFDGYSSVVKLNNLPSECQAKTRTALAGA